MTQVVYGQKGYLGSSMSVRAAEAYEQGEMPISRWTKTAIIQAVKDYCFDFDLAYDPDIEKKTKAELAKEFLEYKSEFRANERGADHRARSTDGR